MSHELIAGLGLRRGCKATEILALVQQAGTAVGRPISAMAAPSFRRGEPGLIEAAAYLQVDLLMIDDHALHAMQPRCVTHSTLVERAVGHSSVAEASALAAAGPRGRLILPRIKSRSVTCALAEMP
ncbi:MAG: cobalamin biosynthesis protein [Janthinobacterium lividum]